MSIFGFLLVLVMVLRPQGLIPERRRKLELTRGIGETELEEPGASWVGCRARGGGAMTVETPAPTQTTLRPPILSAEDVSKEFGGLVAVNDVSIDIPVGSIVSIIGPNGAGKTTFFNMLTGLYKPTQRADRVRRAATSPTMRPDVITKLGVARTFQNIRLFGAMTALENVIVGRHCRMRAGLFGSIVRAPWVRAEERAVQERARETLVVRRACAANQFDQLASNLSYGDQRRVEIARALASDPKLLLLDEPTAGMNPQESAALTEFMRKLRDELELTILLIEHDMKVVMGVSERITVLDHGEKIAEGAPAEVRAEPARDRGLPRKAGARWRSSRSTTSTPTTARSRRSRACR